MFVYLTVMLAWDCQHFVFGAYASPKQACAAVPRCLGLEKSWQYHATQGKVLCFVQKVGIGQDDQVEEVLCPDDQHMGAGHGL